MARALPILLGLFLALPAAAEEPRLEDVQVQADGVVVQTSLPATYKKSRASDPERLILEFSGVRCPGCPRSWKGNGSWLTGIRAGQFREQPPVTRIVLDLGESVPLYDSYEGKQIHIRPGEPAAKPRAAAPAPAAKPAPAPEPAPAAQAAPISPPDANEPTGMLVVWLQYTGLGFAVLTLGVALYRIRWLRSNLSAVRSQGGQEALRVEKKVDRELVTLIRRVSALEAKLAELQEAGPSAQAGGIDPEELKQFRTVVKSLADSIHFPKN